MKLWLLRWEGTGVYPRNDEMVACLVRTESEAEARQLANEHCQGEGFIWLDRSIVTCEEVALEGDPGLLLSESHYT